MFLNPETLIANVQSTQGLSSTSRDCWMMVAAKKD